MLKLIVLALFIPQTGADKLDTALASAIFQATGSKCPGAGVSTSFSATYTSTSAISKWDVLHSAYEPNVFEVDIIHSDTNENRTWTLRIGKGGQIASLRVAAGEAISNQADTYGAWNDLVQQMVAVNLDRNTATNPNFIHQAGPYMKDTGLVNASLPHGRHRLPCSITNEYFLFRLLQHASAILFS